MNYIGFCKNCKNNEVIESLFKDNNINEEILEKFAPTLFLMYKNNFGYLFSESNEEKITSTKKIIFDTLLNTLKITEKENFKAFTKIIKVICLFCEVLTDEDKYFIFSEIKTIFYNSIFNQNISFKELFNFIINYSTIAVKKSNVYKIPDSEQGKNEKKKISSKNLKISKKDSNVKEEIKIDINSFSFDEKQYYGLELIYSYLSFEQYSQIQMNEQQKIEFINLASDGVINIISNIKSPTFALNTILNKIFDSIKNQKDVLQHLLLLIKLLQYSKLDTFYLEFNKLFGEYLQKVDLIVILIDELSSFLDNLASYQIIDSNVNENNNNININDIEIENQNENQNAYLNENYNIKIRIKTIFNLIVKYNKTKFDYSKIEGFILKLIKFNEFTKNTLYQYLSKYVVNFSKNFLMYLYTNIISKKDIFIINNLTTYSICKNIIIEISKRDNLFFLMNNKDIGFVINKNDIKNDITGIDLLWDLILNKEQNIDKNIITDLIDFLCNLYFGVRIKSATNIYKAYEEYWTNLINKLSDKLKKLTEDKDKNIKGIKCLILLIKKIINKISNESGEIIKDLKEIEKESNKYNNKKPQKEYTFFRNNNITDKPGNENYNLSDIKINGGDYFYILRYRLSNHYNIPVNQIGLTVYLNSVKNKKITKTELDKIYKTLPLKEYNFLNDFENIYDQLNGLYDWNNQGKKKKFTLLIEVKLINNIGNDIFKTNPVDIIYKKSKLPMFLMNLLKEEETPYTNDVLSLVKGNVNNNNAINDEIKNLIINNKNSDLFNFEKTSIYYISYIISNLNNTIKNNLNNNEFIDKFLVSHIWNDNIKNFDKINNGFNYNINEDQKMPLLGELLEKYNLINNLVNIYIVIAENLGRNDVDLALFIISKIIKIYNFIIIESTYLNLNKCGKSEEVSINDVKQLYNETLKNINNLIINNEKIFNYIIKSLISNEQTNEEMKNIKETLEYILFESIIKNKYKSINKIIKSLLFEIINKLKNISNKKESQSFYNYLLQLYLTENSFNKIINIYKEINNKNIDINKFKYNNNSKILFDIISEVLLNIYEYIKDKFNINDYINKLLLPKIYNIYIPNINKESIFHQLLLGGVCKLFFTSLLIDNNSYDLSYDKNKQLIEYLFNSIIMSKCFDNSVDKNNINKENISIAIISSFCIKEASNLFCLLLFKNNDNNENVYNNYIEKLNSLHKLCHWKGNKMSDWKLYYKESQKSSPFVGLKNLGCTCYINSLIQIFYHTPLIRESLLKCDYSSFNEKNCFYQLIKIFFSLKYLQTSFYVPTSFVENYDNEKLNVNVQMDAFEFFCDFLDKIEQKIKNTKNENIIKYFFMGRQNDVLKFEGDCTHHRVNESQFYSIQLQVQGKKNIYESLDTLIEGEHMDGDNCIHCPECDKKVPAIKSQNFKTLPRIFMFVLKRFEYNYQTMKKIKINDYYEFPLILDMNKYTEEYINNNENQTDNKYELKSIIIHTGDCDNGHYCSFILDEESKEWYEFNDINIQKFNINNLDKEAFGKKEIINEKGNNKEIENKKNAYMVFYEKINKDNCEQFNNVAAINELNGGENNNNNNKDNQIDNINNINNDEDDFNLLDNNDIGETQNNNEINTNVIDDKNNKIQIILDSINKETLHYFLNQRLFSGEYHHFILSLFINIYNKYNSEKLLLNESLCSNNNLYAIAKEIKEYRKDRKTSELSNIENYLTKKKIYIFDLNKKYNIQKNKTNIKSSKEDEDKILELFKHLIIYFFNVMIRAREKDYLGGTVNLIKYFINNYLFCADYIIEEFSNYNFLIEYMINCPSYEIKKLIVGIIYCAMLKCVTTYENKIRQENRNQINQISTSTQSKKNKKQKKESNKQVNKIQEQSNQSKEEQIMSDEELARKLQEAENMGSNGFEILQYNNSSNDTEINSNPLDRKYIPSNVLKLIYNTLHIIIKIQFINLNEARFLYLIIYRFSLISKKTKKFLINKALFLEFLNVSILPQIKEQPHDETKMLISINKEVFPAEHQILNTHKKELKGIYDKGGAFHYENYINMLYFYLLSYNQKPNAKHPYFEDTYHFDNKAFVRALFFKINTKQDAYNFAYLICSKCNNSKNYKKRIEYILYNLVNILEKADNNDKINYDVNSNRDNYNKGVYSENNNNFETDFPKINPKYILLIYKRLITKLSDNPKINEYRINLCLKYLFILIEKNAKYYNFNIMLIDFVSELFINNSDIMNPYVNSHINNFKDIIKWLKNNPISPELYRIEGLFMYKSDNVAYRDNITDEERCKFNEMQLKNTEKRVNKIKNIIDLKVSGYDNEYEVDFDLTDFKFRKGDYIYYNKQKAIIKEYLDELILIKIIGNDNNKDNKDKNPNISKNKNESYEDAKSPIAYMEKVKFWVAKDDKNICVYNLE